MKQSVAMAVAMNEIVQDASKSGNALKTMSANFSGLTTSAKDGSIQLTKAGKTLKEIAGIEIWNQQTGEVKDMFTVVDELHSKWDGLSEAQRMALGSAVAGKTQLNTFNALMSNWETAKQLVDEYNQGLTIGSAEKENLRYLDSINGKWNTIKENMKGVANTLVTSDMTKGLLDGVVAVTDGLNAVTKVGTGFLNDMFKGNHEEISGSLYNLIEGAFGGLGSFGGKIAASFSDFIGETLVNPIFERVMGMTNLGKILTPFKGLFDIFNVGSESRELQDQIDDRKYNIQGINAEIQALSNQKKAIDEILPSYEKLSKNTNRSAKENQQLAEMRNQLAEIAPDLVLGYESDGTPILKNLQLQNKQLEAQIKLKQQSQRVEENALALDTQKQRVNDLKEYNKALQEYNDTVSVLDTDRKENLFGQKESLQDYAKRIQDGNAKIAQNNQEAYRKRLEDHQKYIADEKAIQEKYINQMESSNTFGKMTDEMKSGMLTFMDALDWSQFTDLGATDFTNQLSKLGDKFASTTADMGKHSEAITKLTNDYANGQINLEKYTKGLTEQYEAAGKFDAESFTSWRTGLQSYIDSTGDLVGANRAIDEMATSLNKITGIDTSTWKTALSFDPAPIDASNKALQKFLNSYGTGIQNLGKGGLADSLTSQFETLQSSYTQMVSDLASGKEIDVEYLMNAKINQPEPIGNLIEKIIADEKIEEQEIEILLNAQAELLNTGEISQETISQIAEEFNMTEADVVAMLNVKTEVKETGKPFEEIKSKWDSLEVGEKVLSLVQQVIGGDLLGAAKTAWDGLNVGEKIQSLVQKAIGSDLLSEAKSKWDGLSIGEKIQTLVQMATGTDLLSVAKTAWDGLNVGEKIQSLVQKVQGGDLFEKAKGIWEGLNIGEKVQTLVQKVTGKDEVESAKQNVESLPKEKTISVQIKQAGANLLSSIADWIKSKTKASVEVDAKVGKVDTNALSNVQSKDIEVKAKVGKVDTSSISSVKAKPIEIEAKVGKVDTSSVSSINVRPIEIEARVGKVDTSSISSISVPPIEVKANVGSALSQVNSIKSALNGIQTKNITVTVGGNALSQVNSIKSAMNGIQSKSISINASGNALGQINAIKSALAGLQSKSIAVNTAVSGTAQVNALKSAIASLQGKSVSVNATTTGTSQVNALTSAIAKVQSKTVSVTARVTGTSQVNALTSAINRVKSKSVSVSARVSGTGAVQSLASAIASVRSKTATVSVTKRVTTIQSSVPAKRSITPMLTNTSLSNIPVSMSAPVTPSANTTPMVTASDTSPVSVTAKAMPNAKVDLGNLMKEFDLDVDSFKTLREELERIANVYEIIEEKTENAFGSDKIDLLNRQLALLREQQGVQKALYEAEKKQNGQLNAWLKGKGFQIDTEGNINNYQNRLVEWEQWVKSLKDKYDQLNDVASDKKNEDAINSAKKAYESANEELESIKEHLEEYFETNNREMPEAKKKMEEYVNQIKEIETSIREIQNKKITIQIDDISGQIDVLESKLDVTASSTSRIKYMEEQNGLYERQKYLLSQLIDQMARQRGTLAKGSDEYAELTSKIHEANEELWNLEKSLKDNKMSIFEESTRGLKDEINYVASQIDLLDAEMESYSGKEKLDRMDKQIEMYYEQMRATQKLDRMLKSQLKLLDKNSEEYAEMRVEIAELVTEEWELTNNIREALRDKLEITKDIEDEITEIYEKEYERREKEIEEFHDKQIEMLEKEKNAYNEMRNEQEYKKSVNDQIEEIAKLNQQIETAKRDNTIGGVKRLKELTEELREAQEELGEMTQDKIDSDYENNIDKEIERLENQEESLLKNLEEKFSEVNIGKMVAQAMSSGVIEINGEIKSLQDAMIESINSSAEGYSAMAQVIKNELVSNLGIALETVRELDHIYSGLNLQDFGTPNVNIDAVATPTSGVSTKNITVGDTNITIQGSVDNATLEEIEQLIKDSQDEMLQRIAQDL